MKAPVVPPVARFALASLAPLPLLAAGALTGGVALAAALLWLTLLPALIDRIAPALPEAPDGSEFPASDALLVALGAAHLMLLPLAVLAVTGATGLNPAGRIAAFFAFGLQFGQVSVPAAHELIHRGNRALQALGTAIYVTILFGHHASAHRFVHHRHAATAADPNTARRGEGFYRFFLRAWAGSFRAGLAAETARYRGGLHPYAIHLGAAAGALALSGALAGPAGIAAHAGLALHATAQLLLADYVQHYGLRRRTGADGRAEPVGVGHSWNAPHPASGAMTLNAPRHSDHHANPQRPYPALRLPPGAPTLPRSLPVMAALALLPPLWRRVMDPRVAALAGSREREPAPAGAAPADLAG